MLREASQAQQAPSLSSIGGDSVTKSVEDVSHLVDPSVLCGGWSGKAEVIALSNDQRLNNEM